MNYFIQKVGLSFIHAVERLTLYRMNNVKISTTRVGRISKYFSQIYIIIIVVVVIIIVEVFIE